MLAALPGHRLRYLESDGDSYIDTGILPVDELKIIVTFSHASAAGVTSAPRQYIFGTFSRSGYDVVNRMQFIHGGDGSSSLATRTCGRWGWGQGSTLYDYSESQLTADSLTITADKNAFVLDGANIFAPQNHVFLDFPQTIYLFASNAPTSDTVYKSNGVRIMDAYFELDGAALSRFVPWEIGSRAGMMDLVNGVFHDNIGAGSFLRG